MERHQSEVEDDPRESTAGDDPRGEARLIDTVIAVQLALEGNNVSHDAHRTLRMIAWLLDDIAGLEPNGTVPTRLFIAAIQATKKAL